MAKVDPDRALKEAADALSDLNTFAILVTILDGGHIHAPSHAAASRIIRICKAEQDRRLRDYDRLKAKARAGYLKDTTDGR